MPGPKWTAELETALVRALRAEQLDACSGRFRGLRPAALRLTDAAVLGRWIPRERTIEIQRRFAIERPWCEVVEVLRHELAHQYVHEVLGVRDEPPHGPTFRRVCAERGVDARAAGLPRAPAESKSGRVVEKIRKLLALAGSSNQHEAELAMRRAQELMLKHQLSDEVARGRYVVRQLGTPRRRKSSAEGMIGGLLAKHFFVQAIWARAYMPWAGCDGSVLEICGTEENVAMAEYVHAFLMQTLERLWKEARTSRPELSGRDRSAFMCGVVGGFMAKLEGARTEHEGAGLVWLGDPELERYFQLRYPRIRAARAARTTRIRAHALGREEGKKVVLHRPLEGPSRAGGPKLLSS